MGKPLRWLKMAPLLCPLVSAQGQRNVLRPAPALTCTVHNSSLEIGGVCDKEKIFWHALRDCRYSSVPPRLEHEEGEEEESMREGFVEEGESLDHEEKLFGANAAEEFKREQVGVADVDWLKLTDRELQMQCRVETLRSSGPGGQHRNKTESAVRLLHLPTGCVAFVILSDILLKFLKFFLTLNFIIYRFL